MIPGLPTGNRRRDQEGLSSPPINIINLKGDVMHTLFQIYPQGKSEAQYSKDYILRIALIYVVTALLISVVQGSIFIVDKNNPGAYPSINQAIQKSNDGDIIEVHGGTYVERLVINKRLILRGIPKESGKPIIDFRPYKSYRINMGREDINYWGILINAAGVVFEGFDLIGLKDNDYGIIINSNNTTIRGNIIDKMMEGIFVNGSDNIISENSITNCKDKGIYLKCLGANIIVGNIITGNGFGVWTEGQSPENLIYCNNFTNNGLNAYDLDASSIWNNGKIGNYYSDFHLPAQGCYDVNHDNICDDPYEIQGKYPNNKSIDRYPSVTQRSPPCCPLRVQVIPSRNNATVGQNITLTYVISNYGGSRLGNIYLNNSKTGESLIKGLKLEPDQSTKIDQNYTIGDLDFPGPLNITVNVTGMDYSTFKEVSATCSASVRTSSRVRTLPSDLNLSMSSNLSCIRNLTDRINFTTQNITSKVRSPKIPDQMQSNIGDIQRKIDAFRHEY